MKPVDPEGELLQHPFPYRLQPTLADLRCRPHHFPLRDLIHRIDGVHALAMLHLIALGSMVRCLHAEENREQPA